MFDVVCTGFAKKPKGLGNHQCEPYIQSRSREVRTKLTCKSTYITS